MNIVGSADLLWSTLPMGASGSIIHIVVIEPVGLVPFYTADPGVHLVGLGEERLQMLLHAVRNNFLHSLFDIFAPTCQIGDISLHPKTIVARLLAVLSIDFALFFLSRG